MFPFWFDGEKIYFRSSDISDEGIYLCNSIGLTIAVVDGEADFEFPAQEVVIPAQVEKKPVHETFGTEPPSPFNGLVDLFPFLLEVPLTDPEEPQNLS